MDSFAESIDPPLPDFDQSSINFLNLQARRLHDFSMLDSPEPKGFESKGMKEDNDDSSERDKIKNVRYSNNQSPERPHSRGGVTMMREQDNTIGELKKECFGLKLRIYYMEEQLRDTFDANTEDLLKDNVELKVAVGELRNDVAFKTELLTKASQAMQLMSDENKHSDSLVGDKTDYKGELEEKNDQIKKLEHELYKLNEKIADYENTDDKESKLQRLLNEKEEKYKLIVVKKQQDEESLKSMVCELEQTLVSKESNIETLRNDLRRLASNKPDHGVQHYKALYEKTGKVLADKENTIIQMKTELSSKSELIDSLNEHIANFDQGMKDSQIVNKERELEMQNSILKLKEQIKKQNDTIQEKGNELQEKDKALTEAMENNLLVNQQKVQYELDTMKTKDSHIIELEIKAKQQNIDLERTVDGHNRTLKEKEDDVLRLQGLFLAAQQEIKRLKVEEKQFKSLNDDLKKSFEIALEKERSIYTNLEGLILKPNDKKESENMSLEFIKNLQQQIKEKDSQIAELKAMKDEVVTSATHKCQKLILQVKSQESTIMGLNKALSIKDIEISDKMQKMNVSLSTNSSEHNTLLSALLKEKTERDEMVKALMKSLKEKEDQMTKTVADSENIFKKNKQIESLKKHVKELKSSITQVEKEKVIIDTECRSLTFQKESLQKQLTNFNTLLSCKEVDPKESATSRKLENLAGDFENVIESYKSFLEKLNNNQHPDSQMKVLQKEISEVEQTRENFQNLLITFTNKTGENDLSDIVKKDKTLKSELEESRKRTTSLEEQLFGISKYQRENESLKKDIKRYEDNERKLKDITEQMEKMKIEYELLITEREEEIKILMKNMNQEKQVTELLTQQKEMLSQQLEEKQKKLNQDTSTLENTKEKLEDLIENKEICISDLRKEITSLQKENGELTSKLTVVQSELNISYDNLSKLNSDFKNAESNISSLEGQLNTSIENGTCEKRSFKKDVKDLFEMNVRLKKKVKAYELVIEKKDSEKEKLKELLEKAGDTTKQLEMLLSNTNDKTALEGEMQYLRGKINELENDNITLNVKIDEIKKANESCEEKTVAELKRMRELVNVFTDENVTLKSDIHKMKQEKNKVHAKHLNDLDEKNEEISHLKINLDSKRKENDDEINKKDMLEYALNKKTKENEVKDTEINSMKNSLQKQSETIADNSSKNSKLQDKLTQKLEEINKKDNDVSSLKSSLDKQSTELKIKISEHGKLRTEFEKQTKDLQEKMIENKVLIVELEKVKETLADNKLSEKLTAELVESKSLINVLQSKISSFDGSHGDILQLKEEIKCLEEAKLQLKEENRKLKQSGGEMSQKLSFTLDDNNIKVQEIKVLKTQMIHLEEKIESFSPLYTSSAHNIALSSDAFTQTKTETSLAENSDSLIMQHIKEMQQLRKQLEDTINNNDSLKMQLEERLNEVEQDASLMQDPHLRITLIRDNDTLRMKLNEADGNQKKLKQEIEKMKEEKENDSATIDTLNSQIHELSVISTNLKMEMEVYDRLIQQLGIKRNKQFTNEDLNSDFTASGNDLDKNLLLALLEEIRDLRDQLQLTIDVNNLLREKLEKELGHPVPEEVFKTPGRDGVLKTPGMSIFTPRSLFSGAAAPSISTNNASRDESIAQNTQSLADYPSLDETPTKDIGIDGNQEDSIKSAEKPTQFNANSREEGDIAAKIKDIKMLKQLSMRVYEKLYVCIKKLKTQKDKSIVIAELTEIMKLSKELSKMISSLRVTEKNDACKKDDESNCEFEIATKLLKACDTLKATKGNLQLRNTTSSRPVSRNHSPIH